MLWLAAVIGIPAPEPAQAQSRITETVVSVNLGAQLETQRLSQTIDLDKYFEPAPVTGATPDAGVPFVEVAGRIRFGQAWGVGVAVSYLSGRDAAAVSGFVPHPFYVDQPRTISGEAQRVRHREAALHAGAAYRLPLRRVNLTVAGGPTLFRVEQDFVTDVAFLETFPYDSVTFTGATLTRVAASRVGYHAAADLVWPVARLWGVGALIRFSRASMRFTTGGVEFGEMKTGGLQAGGGLRLIF
jgi:hypothetical protein